jgi:hypothetical protein
MVALCHQTAYVLVTLKGVPMSEVEDLLDLEFRFSPEVMRREMVRASALLALNRFLYLQTAERWRTFDDPMAEINLQVSPPATFDLNDTGLETALKELTKGETLDASDVRLIREVHSRAREVFERLPDLLMEGKSVGTELFEPACLLIRKLELFWARINIDCNPEFDGREIADEEIGATISGGARTMVAASLAV